MLLTINELGIADAMDLRIAINAQDLAAKVNVTSPELLFRLMRSAATASRPGPLQRACRLSLQAHFVLKAAKAQRAGQSCTCTPSSLCIAPSPCSQQQNMADGLFRLQGCI